MTSRPSPPGDAAPSDEPPGRIGSFSFFRNGRFFLFQGYSTSSGPAPSHCSLQVFDPQTGGWQSIETSGDRPPRHISGSCYAVVNGCLYSFGGRSSLMRSFLFRNESEAKYNIHELNLESLVWRKIQPTNIKEGPFFKDKAGMVGYGEMLCLFGGYGCPGVGHVEQPGASYDYDEQQSLYRSCWTNELHLFVVKEELWVSPEVTGTRPPPCAAFSMTEIDSSRVVIFGGRHREGRVNQVHILNMGTWHWSGAILSSRPEEPWPIARSFHTACCVADPNYTRSTASDGQHQPQLLPWLPCAPPNLKGTRGTVDPRVFVLWGMDQNGDPVPDAWMLDINSLTWKVVALPACAGQARIWHTMASHYPSPGQAEVVMFGGCQTNPFSQEGRLITSVNNTTVIKIGAGSLYQMCVEYICTHWDVFSPLVSQLPSFMQQTLLNCHSRADKFTSIQL